MEVGRARWYGEHAAMDGLTEGTCRKPELGLDRHPGDQRPRLVASCLRRAAPAATVSGAEGWPWAGAGREVQPREGGASSRDAVRHLRGPGTRSLPVRPARSQRGWPRGMSLEGLWPGLWRERSLDVSGGGNTTREDWLAHLPRVWGAGLYLSLVSWRAACREDPVFPLQWLHK